MFDVDPKFFNEDGSINYETALDAGRDARAAAMADTLRASRGGVTRLLRSLEQIRAALFTQRRPSPCREELAGQRGK